MAHGKIAAVCTSKHKGTPKSDVGSGFLDVGYGLRGDAHGGDWHRQVSLLSTEQIDTMKGKGLEVGPGSFAENLTTSDFDLGSVKIGDRIRVGGSAILEITQIGKECHTRCAIYHTIGECIMPEQGVFARVIVGGEVRTGDRVDFESRSVENTG
ncbi:MAG: MOSC domain-containing protein [Pseudomonadota bacterium]